MIGDAEIEHSTSPLLLLYIDALMLGNLAYSPFLKILAILVKYDDNESF
jgi:hypothetical protein